VTWYTSHLLESDSGRFWCISHVTSMFTYQISTSQVFRNASYVETRQCVILNVIIVTLCHVYSLCIGDVMCGGC